MKKILTVAATFALTGVAAAATSTGTLDVTATVAPACVVSTTTNTLAFPTFNPTVGAVTAQTNIGITCNNGLGYTVSLDNGSNFLVTRRMTDGSGNYLEYSLNRPNNADNNNSGSAWGTTPNVVTRTGSGVEQLATVYGTIPFSTANQAAVTGSYTDTVTITVTF